jgi:hypothetical protein
MNISVALAFLRPGAQWVLSGDSYDGLEWLDDSVKPSLDELESAWPEVEASRVQAELEVLAAKESAFEKLAGWGLTPDEIATILTP